MPLGCPFAYVYVYATNHAVTLKAIILKELLKPANINQLDKILELHVVDGKVLASDLRDGEKIKTVSGGELTVTITKDGKVFISSGGTKASQVIAANNLATNGVVHVVDTVLLPSFIPPSPPNPPKTIPVVAAATHDLSTLVTALNAGGLINTLNGKGPFTVFAPTNEAFFNLPAGVLANLLKPENKAELDDLLTYHVVAGAVFAKDLKDGESVKTIEGLNLKVRIVGGAIFINSAKVQIADVNATNGVIHIIDEVLIPQKPPPPPTIVAIAASDPDFSTLVTALKAADLIDTLDGTGPFTVFAPTNEAFAKLPDGVLANLLKPENKAQLVALLTYHVVAGKETFQHNMGNRVLATLQGETITIEWHEAGGGNRHYYYYIDYGKKSEVRFNTGSEIDASNGLIYPINVVLSLPPPPPPQQTIAEIAVATKDLSTLVIALQAGGLVNTLNGTGPFTVFAPTNEAFLALPSGTLTSLLLPQNKAKLVDLLTYHVVAGGRVFAKDLKDGEKITTLEGKSVEVTILGESTVEINNAVVVKADVNASNGVVHLINRVLIPPANTTTLIE
jgi:uncharacterized surface protein with fasciclin (FAS1) repeats